MTREAYRQAGVDVGAADLLTDDLKRLIPPDPQSAGIGDFAGLFAMPQGLEEPLLVASTDGVGTKLLIAQETGLHAGVGQDLVAMCANDVAVLGAKPLFMLDYIALGNLDAALVREIVAGVAAACESIGCALLGGETAELPGMLSAGRYDLAGFCVGVVERPRVLGAHRVREGDALVAFPSSGLHANGFSLVRALLRAKEIRWEDAAPWGGGSLARDLLEPTRLYVALLATLSQEVELHAAAHITGGGVLGNLARILPAHLSAHVRPWPLSPLFAWLGELAGDDLHGLAETFNCGAGLIIALPEAHAERAAAMGEGWVVGSVHERTGSAASWSA